MNPKFIKIIALITLIAGLLSCKRNPPYPFDDESVIMDQNVSAEFMRKNGGLPLGDNCEKIYCYTRAGGLQDFTMLAKFDCPEKNYQTIVKSLIDWNDGQLRKNGDRITLNTAPFDFGILPSNEISKIPWWDLKSAKITSASISKELSGCSFWITEPLNEHVTIYVYQK